MNLQTPSNFDCFFSSIGFKDDSTNSSSGGGLNRSGFRGSSSALRSSSRDLRISSESIGGGNGGGRSPSTNQQTPSGDNSANHSRTHSDGSGNGFPPSGQRVVLGRETTPTPQGKCPVSCLVCPFVLYLLNRKKPCDFWLMKNKRRVNSCPVADR